MIMKQPNVLLILNDDMGYSDIGCYGGDIETPNIDALATEGVRFSQFYNTARCSPSRASLLTGLHPHQTGIGILTYDNGPEGYPGDLNEHCVTMAEVLKDNDYQTYMSGKWHIAKSLKKPSNNWPLQRGFDEFYGTIIGAGGYYDPNIMNRGNENIEHETKEDDDFYYTNAISDQSVQYIKDHTKHNPDKPFFQYVAYTAPHWPLHAKEEDIEKYAGRFDKGWDKLREERMQRLIEAGIIDDNWPLTDRDPTQPAWENAEDKAWLLKCMEVYAAQIDNMDQGIGRIKQALEEEGELNNTIIIFLSDNGACAENIPVDVTKEEMVDQLSIAKEHTRRGEKITFGNDPSIMPGPENTYQSYGVPWANLSNTPFRLYKHWIHEGGIATPLIVHWPDGIKEKGVINHTPGQLTDIMATILDITGAQYPSTYKGQAILPPEGKSLRPALSNEPVEDQPLYWEHEGHAAIRIGKWKLVKAYPGDWELFDMDKDRTELNDLAREYPERVKDMATQYESWAERGDVVPRDKILELMEKDGVKKAFWETDLEQYLFNKEVQE